MLAVTTLCPPALTATLASISDIATGEKFPTTSLGVVVKCLDSSAIIASLNPDSQYIPASVAKLVTGAAAIETFGASYTLKTRIYAGAGLRHDSGIIAGDLYVRGGADPGMVAERVWLLAKHLGVMGVRKIRGDLILDESYFDSQTEAPGYEDDNSSRAYEALVGPLSASWNAVMIHCQPGDTPGAPLMVNTFPELAGLQVLSTAKTAGVGATQTVKAATEQRNGSTVVTVSGSMPLNAAPKIVYQRVWDSPGKNFGNALVSLFPQCGISLSGAVRPGTTPDSLLKTTPLVTFESRPLAEFLGYMFKFSSNFTADMLFKVLGAELRGGTGGSWADGAAAVRGWWKSSGLPGDLTLINGSGMGKRNRLSAGQIVALLEHVWGRKTYFPEYCAALATAGVDGTVKSRFTKSRLKGLVRAKTGTLNSYGVSTLAGYAFCNGRTYAFAILINCPSRTQFQQWTLQEKILEGVLP